MKTMLASIIIVPLTLMLLISSVGITPAKADDSLMDKGKSFLDQGKKAQGTDKKDDSAKTEGKKDGQGSLTDQEKALMEKGKGMIHQDK